MQDFLSDVEELDALLSGLKFLGCRGTTGTEASFMDLFDGDEEKIDEMIEGKRALAAQVLGAGEAWLTELSTAQLRELVALRV